MRLATACSGAKLKRREEKRKGLVCEVEEKRRKEKLRAHFKKHSKVLGVFGGGRVSALMRGRRSELASNGALASTR